jgi:hypothetical protein
MNSNKLVLKTLMDGFRLSCLTEGKSEKTVGEDRTHRQPGSKSALEVYPLQPTKAADPTNHEAFSQR